MSVALEATTIQGHLTSVRRFYLRLNPLLSSARAVFSKQVVTRHVQPDVVHSPSPKNNDLSGNFHEESQDRGVRTVALEKQSGGRRSWVLPPARLPDALPKSLDLRGPASVLHEETVTWL